MATEIIKHEDERRNKTIYCHFSFRRPRGKPYGLFAVAFYKDYEGKQVHLICVLKGSIFFTCELAKRIPLPVTLDFLSVSSYSNP